METPASGANATLVFHSKRKSIWRAAIAAILCLVIVALLATHGSIIAAAILLAMGAATLFVTVSIRSPDSRLELRSDGLVFRNGPRSIVTPWSAFDQVELVLEWKRFLVRFHYAPDSEQGRRLIAAGRSPDRAYTQILPADYGVDAKELFDLVKQYHDGFRRQRQVLADMAPQPGYNA